VLEPKSLERRLEALRIAARDRIHEHQRRGLRGTLDEFRRRAQGVQVGELVSGAHPGEMARQVREHRIQFAGVRTRALLNTARPDRIETGVAGRGDGMQAVALHGSHGRRDADGRKDCERPKCQET
jgi:hypothetical protein